MNTSGVLSTQLPSDISVLVDRRADRQFNPAYRLRDSAFALAQVSILRRSHDVSPLSIAIPSAAGSTRATCRGDVKVLLAPAFERGYCGVYCAGCIPSQG